MASEYHKTRTVTARIPEEMSDALYDLAAETPGMTVSAWVRKFIEEGLTNYGPAHVIRWCKSQAVMREYRTQEQVKSALDVAVLLWKESKDQKHLESIRALHDEVPHVMLEKEVLEAIDMLAEEKKDE